MPKVGIFTAPIFLFRVGILRLAIIRNPGAQERKASTFHVKPGPHHHGIAYRLPEATIGHSRLFLQVKT